MKAKYMVRNNADDNVAFEVEANTVQQALHKALEGIGWSIKITSTKEKYCPFCASPETEISDDQNDSEWVVYECLNCNSFFMI